MPGSFSWAITDKRYEHQPWKHETFRGYFTDIRRAARKSLPKRPNKDLCNILGLSLVPAKLEHDISCADRRLSESVVNAPVSLSPVIIRTADRPPDILPEEKHNKLGTLKDTLLCRISKTENCSGRERTVFGFAVYFAIIIFILLIIVLILSTTLSRLNEDEASDENVQTNPVTTFPPTTLEITKTQADTSASLQTTKTSGRTTNSFSKTNTNALTSSTRKSSSSNPSVGSSKSVTTTKRSQSSNLSTLSSMSTVLPFPNTNSATSTATQRSSTVTSTSDVNSATIISSSIETTARTSPSVTPSSSSSTSRIPTKSSSLTTVTSITSSLSSSSVSAQTTKPSLSTDSVTKGSSETSISSSSPTISDTSIEATSIKSAETSVSNKLLSTSSTSTSTRTSLSSSTFETTSRITSEPTLPPTSPSSTIDPAVFPRLDRPDITCTSRTCLAVNKTLNRVDFDRSPCIDFYDFSCGRWTQEWNVRNMNGSVKNIPETLEDELRQNLLTEINGILQRPYREDESFSAKVTKRLYQSCIESNNDNQIVLAMQEVHDLLEPFGMNANGYIQNQREALLKDAVSRFEVTPFFKLSPVTTVGEDGIKVHALKIEPPSLFLSFGAYKQPVEDGNESYKYVEGLSRVLQSYLSSLTSRKKRQTNNNTEVSTPSFEEIFKRVTRIYYIEANISRILEEAVTIGDAWYSTLYYTYSEVKVVYSSISWDAAVGQDRNFLVHLVEFQYFQALNNLWRNLDEDDMKLFIFMNVLVKRVWPYMKLPFRRLLSNIGVNDDMVYSQINCVEIALDLTSEEIHALYIGQYTQNVLNNRQKLTNLKNKVSETFQKFVSTSEWIQSDLERAVTSLASNLKMQFSSIRTNVRQTKKITGSEQSFLSLSAELHRQKYVVEMTRLGLEVSEIMMDWTTTRPVFDQHFNAIGLPTGLTVYLANTDIPFEFYGFVGMTMAVELVKVLTGPMNGGVPPQWWGRTNMIAFDSVLQCFQYQLTTFQNTFYDVGNVIILNGAFQLIDQVYFSSSSNVENFIAGSSLTEEMIFVINIAQLHCQLDDGTYGYRLGKERINNGLMNNVNFKQVFNCPDESPMVTKDTCSLF